MSSTAIVSSALALSLDLSKQLAFNPALFASSLTTSHLGRYLLYRPSTPSTQLLAKREAVEGAPSGLLVLAEEQTQGRGRIDGRTWQSPPLSNLYFTLLLRPLRIQTCALVSFAVSIAVCRAISTTCGSSLSPRVKWPNDVQLHGRKVAGVLVDVDIVGSDVSLAAGVGINVNQHFDQVGDEELRANATSVRTARGVGEGEVQREALLAAFCNALEGLLGLSMAGVMAEYVQLDCLVGRDVTVMPKRKEDRSSWYDAKALGFTDDGYLRVRRQSDGEEVRLIADEVSVRPA